MKIRTTQIGWLVVFVATSTLGASAFYSDTAMKLIEYDSATRDEIENVIEIRSTGIELTYSVTEVEAKSNEQLTIRYINDSETMSHNIVLVHEEADIRPVGIASLKAHATDYIPESEIDRIIAYSELAAPGDTVEFSFTVPPPGIYPYICTYSGHFTMMQGRLIAVE